MRVEQAIFGETPNGHALRAASDISCIAPELAARLDLPDTVPPGVIWSPYVSGFALGGWYVLARTFADPAASRPGMVISHAILAPLQELTRWTDLGPLFALLINSPKPPDTLLSIELPTSQVVQSATPDLIATAQALVTRGKGSVVRIGLDGCEELITALWANCWPAIRARFAFRLSFGPHDLVEEPEPTIVCSPSVLAARWKGYRIVGADSSSAVTRAAAILSGSTEATPILNYAQEIGAQIKQFSDLPILEHAFQTGTAVNLTFEESVAIIRLVERLSPECSAGTAAKEVLINKFILLLGKASVSQVLQLRNLVVDGFASSSRIWATLESWAAKKKFEPNENAQMLSAINDALSESDAVEPWRNAIITGLCKASLTTASGFSAAFWRWIVEQADTMRAFSEFLPAAEALETRLVDAAPVKLTALVGDTVMRIAKQKQWFALHGAAAGACLSVKAAIDRQLSVDVEMTYLEGLRAVFRSAAPIQQVEVALNLDEPRLLLIAAERVAENPKILNNANVAEARVQELWLKALELNPAAWDGPRDARKIFFGLLQHLVEGRAVNRYLITALSTTPLADLSEYPHVSLVWGRVHEPALTNLLHATSLGWLKNAAEGRISTPDTQLQTFILSGPELYRVLEGQTPPGVSIQIMATLSQFTESRLIRWLEAWSRSRERNVLSKFEAEALGQLVLKRRWERAADTLFRIRSNLSDVLPALRVCADLLGTIDRLKMLLTSRTTQSDWDCLEAVAVELYPGGPDHDELWNRAGGCNADLQHNGSGRSRWHYALDQVKKGKGPHVRSLLKEMRREYSSNDLLRELDSDARF